MNKLARTTLASVLIGISGTIFAQSTPAAADPAACQAELDAQTRKVDELYARFGALPQPMDPSAKRQLTAELVQEHLKLDQMKGACPAAPAATR